MCWGDEHLVCVLVRWASAQCCQPGNLPHTENLSASLPSSPSCPDCPSENNDRIFKIPVWSFMYEKISGDLI